MNELLGFQTLGLSKLGVIFPFTAFPRLHKAVHRHDVTIYDFPMLHSDTLYKHPPFSYPLPAISAAACPTQGSKREQTGLRAGTSSLNAVHADARCPGVTNNERGGGGSGGRGVKEGRCFLCLGGPLRLCLSLNTRREAFALPPVLPVLGLPPVQHSETSERLPALASSSHLNPRILAARPYLKLPFTDRKLPHQRYPLVASFGESSGQTILLWVQVQSHYGYRNRHIHSCLLQTHVL